MTNEEKIRKEIITTKALAEYLISYNDDSSMYYTSDDNGFYWLEDAINHEIKWLQSESN